MDEIWQHRPAAAGAYIASKSDLQWDDITLTVIPLEDRLDELPLYEKKWWDYRDMHPAKATAIFAQYYGEFYCESHERRYGVPAQDVFRNPIWAWNEEAPVRAKAFWKARRVVDEAGMPYEFFISMFFAIAEDYFEELPRPQELWRYDVFGKVLICWDGLGQSGHVRFPNDDIYKLRYNWQDKPAQHQWQAWLENKLKGKPETALRELQALNGDYVTDDMILRAIAG